MLGPLSEVPAAEVRQDWNRRKGPTRRRRLNQLPDLDNQPFPLRTSPCRYPTPGRRSNYTSFVGGEVKYPAKLYAVDYPTDKSDAAGALFVEFLEKLTKFFRAEATPLNVSAEWIFACVMAAGPPHTFKVKATSFVVQTHVYALPPWGCSELALRAFS